MSEIKSATDFAHLAVDLLDTEAARVFEVVVAAQLRYGHRPNTSQNLHQMRDEILTKLAQAGFIAEIDIAPCYYGEPPVVEIKRRTGGHVEAFDHEQKRFEILKARDRNEEYLGQKEPPNKRKNT